MLHVTGYFQSDFRQVFLSHQHSSIVIHLNNGNTLQTEHVYIHVHV